MKIGRNKIIFKNTMIEIDTNIERIWLLIYLIINLFDLLLYKYKYYYILYKYKTREVTKWKTILEFGNFTIFSLRNKKIFNK